MILSARYWGIAVLLHFNIFWAGVLAMTSIDLTLIGHIRGWRRIRYAKWLGSFINRSRLGYSLVSDSHTHPQVLWALFAFFLALCGSVALSVAVWFVVNDIDPIILWVIDAALYAPAICWLVFSKIWAWREYKKHLQQ